MAYESFSAKTAEVGKLYRLTRTQNLYKDVNTWYPWRYLDSNTLVLFAKNEGYYHKFNDNGDVVDWIVLKVIVEGDIGWIRVYLHDFPFRNG